MSSSGQATDLSMDEILASIRKIISEDPKPSAAAMAAGRPTAAPSAAGAVPRSASQIMTGRQSGESLIESEAPTRPVRALKQALDDDILDLLDEDKGASPLAGVVRAGGPVPPAAGVEAPQPNERQTAERAAPVARPSINDMWTPREWPKPAETTAPAALPASPAPEAKPAAPHARPMAQASEARLEEAIAALGQSLASPQVSMASARPAEQPVKPIVVASAPMLPPHAAPRIDVVAVVNAATRAALAQRSADEQTASTAFAFPAEAKPVLKPAIPAGATVVSAPSNGAPQVAQYDGSVAATAPARSEMVPAEAAPVTAAAVTGQGEPPRARSMITAPAAPMIYPEKPPALQPTAEAGKPATAMPPAANPIQALGTTQPARQIPSAAPAAIAAVATAPAFAVAVPQPAVPVAAHLASAPSVAAPSVSAPNASAAGGPVTAGASGGVQTLEDTVARLLRPMLRQWLDDNMPRIVEKAFKEELAAQAPPAAAPAHRAN